MNIYFSGIGGAGIGPLAEIALDAGHSVVGSDLNKSLFTKELEKRGVKIYYNQDGTDIKKQNSMKPIDRLVYTSALSDDHPELKFARANGISVSKRDDFLADFIEQHNLKLIAVAGTHGKTTTTGMLIWLFQQLGIATSYSIGTTINFGTSGKFDPESKYFIYEADEYDCNFLKFYPHIAILPSVDYDHSDIFPTIDDYRKAFRQFINQSERAVMFDKTFEYLEPISGDIEAYEHITSIQEINLPGQHNRDNAYLAAQAVNDITKKTDKDLHQILSNYPGVGRRFEKLANGIYSDYGHHPTELAATIQLAHEINPNVVVVYQPHQNERQIGLINQYKNVFRGVKKLYWLPTYLPPGDREKSEKILAPDDFINELANPEIAVPALLNDNLWSDIKKHQSNGDLVLVMSAGTADAWLRERLFF